MSLFEKEGYCPGCTSFSTDYPAGKRNALASKTLEILGGREQLMVYAPEHKSWHDEYPSIVDAMLGGNDSTLGIELAVMLKMAVPDWVSGEIQGVRKINLVDCLNPTDFGDDVYFDASYHREANWSFFIDGRASFNHPVRHLGGRTIVYDDRYAIIMVDEGGAEIELRILHIPISIRQRLHGDK